MIFDNKKSSFLPVIPVPQMSKISYANSCMLNDGLLMLTTNKNLHIWDTKNNKMAVCFFFF